MLKLWILCYAMYLLGVMQGSAMYDWRIAAIIGIGSFLPICMGYRRILAWLGRAS